MWMVVCFVVWPCDKLAPCPRWNPVCTLWQLGQAPVLSTTLYASKTGIKINKGYNRLLLSVKHPLCNQRQSWIIPVTSCELVCQISHCTLYVSAGVLNQETISVFETRLPCYFSKYVPYTGSFPPSETNKEQGPPSGDVDVLQYLKQR